MTHKIFFIADTHFGQQSVLTFKTAEGLPLRPFSTLEEMHETIIERWNKVVRPVDKVYHLGDVVFKRQDVSILGKLNGKKILVKGNHDIYKLPVYTPYFEDIRAYKVFSEQGYGGKIICSHIPIHPDSMSNKILNIHGHTHSNKINDSRYFCVSVEQINYTPIEFEEILSQRGIKNENKNV